MLGIPLDENISNISLNYISIHASVMKSLAHGRHVIAKTKVITFS